MYTAVKPLSKYLQYKTIRIYDTIFTIHSKCTVVILLTCTLLLSTRQYFGDPIQCISSEKNTEYIQSYCWTMGMYVIKFRDESVEHTKTTLAVPVQMPVPVTIKPPKFIFGKNFKKLADEKEAYARALLIGEGVGPEILGVTEREYLRYYQWVIILLLVQSFIFYFPSLLWKIWEGQRLKQLCSQVGEALLSEETYNTRLRLLVKYFSTDYQEIHFCYMLKYVFCEVLNFAISVVNFLVLEILLNGYWTKYMEAIATIPFYDWDRWNRVSSRIFPKLAKCEVLKYGPSGTTNILDNLCILPLNILNEKIFVVLWCWFFILLIISGLNILLRLSLTVSKNFREHMIRKKLRFMPLRHVRRALRDLTIGDWFLLMKVSVNVNPMLFGDLMQEMCELRSSSSENVVATDV